MSKRIDEAIVFALNAHSGQMRKMEKKPYIFHPVEVATIISGITDDEDVIIAGLLHDTVEDAGISSDEIKAKFGERVAELVASETENKRAGIPEAETWKIRKQESLEVLKNTEDKDIKILWLGDKLSNIRSFYKSYKKIGDETFNFFHQKDKKEQAWYYFTIADYISELSDTSAYEEYIGLISKIFKEK